ncbi:B-box zinc finger protein 22 [Quercus suber]|uniref:B-box zinc finger protein 22 n=1 Tax=Quercus suber TaxID=58331 RepID=UPI000CE217FA|nr:B-box zinc finger protein 22-like [Quercus suber]
MKIQIQCSACETAEATVVCCADEAALCCSCDHKIHTANKLASKHQRVPLSSSSTTPNCDICQETVGYFFCLEDRALLCRKCDVAIHTANSYVSSHQRFLLTGVKVGLEATEPCASSTKEKLSSAEKVSEAMLSQPMSKGGGMASFTGESEELMPRQLSGNVTLPTIKAPLAGGGTIPGVVPEWCLDEYLGLTGFSQSYGVMYCMLSKADPRHFGA